MITHGVFERFPRLRVRLHGSRLRLAARRGCTASTSSSSWPAPTSSPSSPCRATDYFRRNCWISTECEDPFVADVIRWMGDDHIVYETDFPHPDSKYPHATDEFLKLLPDQITEECKRKILLGQRRGPLPLPRLAHARRSSVESADRSRRRLEYRWHPPPLPGGRPRRGRARLFPPPPEYFESGVLRRPGLIERKQLARLKTARADGLSVPFFRQRWDGAGFDPRDLQSARRPCRVPQYTVDDIRKSIEAHPPCGDYQGGSVDSRCASRCGSTCPAAPPAPAGRPSTPRGTVRSARLLMARGLYAQGIRPGDVVLNSWSYGTHNGAWSLRRGAVPLAELRGADHQHRQRDQHREAGRAGRCSTRPRPS